MAARSLARGGLVIPALNLSAAAVGAFVHSLAGSCSVAGAIALGGALMAAALLPSRPMLTSPVTERSEKVATSVLFGES